MKFSKIALLLGIAVLGWSRASNAQTKFTLRAGADVRPVVFIADEARTIADLGWLGINIAPGFKILEVLTLELAINPLVPITGDPKPSFAFLLGPSARLDLYLAYVRAGVPIDLGGLDEPGSDVIFEAAGGVSFLGSGYFGLLIDYFPQIRDGAVMFGLEIGWNFALGG